MTRFKDPSFGRPVFKARIRESIDQDDKMSQDEPFKLSYILRLLQTERTVWYPNNSCSPTR